MKHIFQAPLFQLGILLSVLSLAIAALFRIYGGAS